MRGKNISAEDLTAKKELALEVIRRLKAEYPDAGCTLDEAVTWLEAEKSTNNIFFTVGNLDYLIKGGRIGKVSGRAANFLGIKPMILFKDGEIYSGEVAAMSVKLLALAMRIMATTSSKATDLSQCSETVGFSCPASRDLRAFSTPSREPTFSVST